MTLDNAPFTQRPDAVPDLADDVFLTNRPSELEWESVLLLRCRP
jgi:hypothetical protein